MNAAFVLHRWAYQEHSYILELFTQQHGRRRVIARGARSAKSKWRGALEPFNLLEADWQGRGDLPTLKQADVVQAFPLQGRYLYSGFYLNELIQRLLPEHYEAADVFNDYRHTLTLLHEQALLEPVLRRFEWQLLVRLDLAFSWREEAHTGQPIVAQQTYIFYPEQGFVAVQQAPQQALVLRGEDILALADFQLNTEQRLTHYKLLMRAALQPHLGTKPLHSRNLFRPQQS